jgi:L-arabinose isomerase
MAGGPHHTVLSTALGVAVVEQFAELTRTELVMIDASSSPSSIRRELKWNAAYQLLAGGLR